MSQALIAQLERIRRELSKQPTPENSRRLMRDFQRAVEAWRDAGNPKTEDILRTLREITSALETLYVADRTVEVGEFTKDLFQVSGKLVEGVAELVRTGMTAQGSKTTAQIAKQLEEKFKGLQLPRIRQWAYTWARTARGAEAQTRAMGVRADVAPEQQFFRYDGPVTNMRPFCAGKIGQVFSLKEIRAMKSPNGLPVEQYCGGYNCRHRWVRVAGMISRGLPQVVNTPESIAEFSQRFSSALVANSASLAKQFADFKDKFFEKIPKPNVLSAEQAFIAFRYSDSSGNMNALLRGIGLQGKSEAVVKQIRAEADLLSEVMTRLPLYDGETFRGESFNSKTQGKLIEEFVKKYSDIGIPFRNESFTSSSKSFDIARRFAEKDGQNDVIFIATIRGKNGRDIEVFSKFGNQNEEENQQEVLFDKGSVFKPLGFAKVEKKKKDGTKLTVYEIFLTE